MQPQTNTLHNVIIENRKKLSVTGVKDVESFTEESIKVITNQGIMTIKGSSLHLGMLNIDSGDMIVDGQIDIIAYSDKSHKNNDSIFKKLLK